MIARTSSRWPRLLRSWPVRDVLVPFLASRAMLVLVGWLALQTFQGLPPNAAGWEVKPDGKVSAIGSHLSPYSYPFLNMWARWDSGWYESIAKSGYEFIPGKQSNTAFFPAYPMAIRALHVLIRGPTDFSWFVSGLIVSNVSLLVALIYLVRLLRLDSDHETAARAALYLLTFPTTLFLSAVYTESFFIAVTLAAFYYARRNRWIIAGVFGGVAALSRSPGILLCAPLAVEYLAQREYQLRKIKPDVLALGLIPAALGGLMWYFHTCFGNMFATRDAQASWGAGWGALRGPFSPFFEMTQRTLAAHEWVDLAFTLLALGLVVYVALRLRPSYGVYALVSYLFLTSWGSFESMPRYILVIFPAFFALALWGRNERFHRSYLIMSSGLAGFFMIVFCLWRWVA